MKRKKTRKTASKIKSGNGGRVFKYLLAFIVISSISIFMFLNRKEINNEVRKNISFAKEKITNVKKHKYKAQDGYKKEDRRKLENLIHEEIKND